MDEDVKVVSKNTGLDPDVVRALIEEGWVFHDRFGEPTRLTSPSGTVKILELIPEQTEPDDAKHNE